MLQLEFDWPVHVKLPYLRQWVIEKIRESGEPLRWAITFVGPVSLETGVRLIRVEAVVINSPTSLMKS